jgi:uncharacterized membrane protein YfcA
MRFAPQKGDKMLDWDNIWRDVIAFLAAVGGGATNALAGGGTNLVFPTLLWLGLHPIKANATRAIALWPGNLGGAWGFRREIAQAERWRFWLMAPALAGGAIGAHLLVHTPLHLFISIAPYLVLASTILIAIEPAINDLMGAVRLRSSAWRALPFIAQFIVAVYGGYFGAGLGILSLMTLGLLGIDDIRQANGLKNLFTAVIRSVAATYFIFTGQVVWRDAILMAVGATIGGYAASIFGHRLKESAMRWIVVAIGGAVAIAMFVKLNS